MHTEEDAAAVAYQIIPNPNKGQFEIVTLNKKMLAAEDIMITTLSGEQVQHISIDTLADKATVNMSGARSGIYYVHILHNGEVLSSKKVVINN